MTRSSQLVIALLLVAALVMGGFIIARTRQGGRATGDNTVIVFAPCGMTDPLNIASAKFRAAHPEMKLEMVYDNANVLVRKIRDGAGADVFISPGEVEIGQLADQGLVERGSIRDFGSFDIVVYAPSKTRDLKSLEDLKQPHIKSISMADPRYNSIGYYGEKALRSLGLWDAVQGKLRLREYPLEAVKLVSQGLVDAGITYLTCPLETAPEKASKSDLRVVATIPRESYPPVRLQLGTLKHAAQPELARTFIDFMASADTQQALSGTGLLPVREK